MDNKKILILAVDVDDDVSKIGVKTPVVGRESVLDAALKLALTTPEDTDVNAIFGAIKQFDKLKSEGFSDIEIALVSGSTSGGVEADLRIREEVSELAQKLKPSGTIFVSDGGEDERVIPIVQSVIPLFSVQRVTVQYSKNIEETYRVLASYIRKGLTEPRLVKYTLGLPGVLILVVAILAVFGFIKYVAYFAAFLLGIVMVFRGFSVLDVIHKSWESDPIHLIGRIVALIVIAAAIATDVEIGQNYTNNVSAGVELIVKDTFDYYVVAMVVYFSSIIASSYMKGTYRFWKDVTAISFILSVRPAIFYLINYVLNNISSIAAVEQFLIKMFSALILSVSVAILSFRLEKWVQNRLLATAQGATQ
ncbi:hypothetical protein B9Q00_02425 [Candidatus Marsarchaeota G1 archaeon OSP_C]|jgi:putative membrane protein|nr:MAG: hypothetical protein B9Q00_02425 [Candidatus Marsarchaeota G1 archaeon OSP_C]